MLKIGQTLANLPGLVPDEIVRYFASAFRLLAPLFPPLVCYNARDLFLQSAAPEVSMGADFILHSSCQPKQTLGDGDDRAGTAEMVRLLKVGHMARYLEECAREEGKSPDELSLTREERNVTTGEVVTRPLTYRQLRAQEERLTPLAAHCAGCPVNVLAKTFGCYGALRYPIRARSEEWLMDRLQPGDTPGGFLCCKAVYLRYDGEPIQRWRDNDLVEIFELRRPIERALDPARPGETTINSNQVWQPLLALGAELQPFHCLYVPLWVGAVRIDGVVPSEPEHLKRITRLGSFEERQSRTGFDVGLTDQGPEVFAVQQLLFTCYMAWLHGVSLLMDA